MPGWRSRVTGEDRTYYRVLSCDRNVGSLLTGAPPASADPAVAGLALPPTNTAEFIKEVTVLAGTGLQDRSGQILWTAELPTTDPGDRYYKIPSSDPLTAYSVRSYDCVIDRHTGYILERVFTK